VFSVRFRVYGSRGFPEGSRESDPEPLDKNERSPSNGCHPPPQPQIKHLVKKSASRCLLWGMV